MYTLHFQITPPIKRSRVVANSIVNSSAFWPAHSSVISFLQACRERVLSQPDLHFHWSWEDGVVISEWPLYINFFYEDLSSWSVVCLVLVSNGQHGMPDLPRGDAFQRGKGISKGDFSDRRKREAPFGQWDTQNRRQCNRNHAGVHPRDV